MARGKWKMLEYQALVSGSNKDLNSRPSVQAEPDGKGMEYKGLPPYQGIGWIMTYFGHWWELGFGLLPLDSEQKGIKYNDLHRHRE